MMHGYIDVYMDYVMICGTRVDRPSSIARSDWMRYWETQECGED